MTADSAYTFQDLLKSKYIEYCCWFILYVAEPHMLLQHLQMWHLTFLSKTVSGFWILPVIFDSCCLDLGILYSKFIYCGGDPLLEFWCKLNCSLFDWTVNRKTVNLINCLLIGLYTAIIEFIIGGLEVDYILHFQLGLSTYIALRHLFQTILMMDNFVILCSFWVWRSSTYLFFLSAWS